MRIVLSLMILVTVVACDSMQFNMDKLEDKPVRGSKFHQALAQEYKLLTRQERESQDWVDAERFARKALQASDGYEVSPENPYDYNIPDTLLAPLVEARQHLLNMVSEEKRNIIPDASAQAVALYDCWVEEQEEEWHVLEINSCRTQFFALLDYLQTYHAQREEDARLEAERANNVQQEDFSNNYVVFFNGGYKMDTVGIKALDTVAEKIKDRMNFKITLNGHSDTAGSDDVNLMLSKQRADVVRDALVERGVPRDRIKVFAFGESDLLVPTADGVANRQNRRVEIFIE